MYSFLGISFLSIYLTILFEVTPSASTTALGSTSVNSVVLPLKRRPTTKSSRHNSGHISVLKSLDSGSAFSTAITVGNQSLEVFVDTGSSNLWLVNTGFQCRMSGGCNLGKTYTPSPTFELLPNVTFHDNYGSGENVTGIVGFDTVTLGDITVKGQDIGLAESGSFYAPGQISGLMGLAYPVNDVRSDGETTTPIFTSMYQEGLIPGFFSLAINRLPFNTSEGPGGYLSLGGLPPVAHSPIFVTSPIVTLPGSPISLITGKPVNEWYSIMIEGVVYGSSEPRNSTHIFNGTRYEMIVDSGTPWNVLPPVTADALNALFVPPAVFDPDFGYNIVNCNAKAPWLGVKIGGEIFYHNGADLVVPIGDGVCVSSIVSNAGFNLGAVGTVNILGDAFLKNVVSIFDVGASEMRFAARLY
ncbi:acid protease [Stipitochalara longipes BDJ]|nr:acid protease [Stipitochalara longipes BDJ]